MPATRQRRVGVLSPHALIDEHEAAVDRGALGLVDRGGVAVREVCECIVEWHAEPALIVGDDVEQSISAVDTNDGASSSVGDPDLVVVAEREYLIALGVA